MFQPMRLTRRLLSNRPLNIVQVYCRLGWYNAAYKRAKAMLDDSNYNRLEPTWNRARHARLYSFVDALDRRANQVPENQETRSSH